MRRLLGVEVPRHRKVPCPFHEDRHASLHVYETAERGWYCFGRCRRGGTIYDLAAPLYGYDPRGEDFLRLRASSGACSDSRPAVMTDAAGARLQLRPHGHPGRDDDRRVARAARHRAPAIEAQRRWQRRVAGGCARLRAGRAGAA